MTTKKIVVAEKNYPLTLQLKSLQDAIVELTPGAYFVEESIILGYGVDLIGIDENCIIHPISNFSPIIFSGNNTIINITFRETNELSIVDKDEYEFDYEINAVNIENDLIVKGLVVNDYKFNEVVSINEHNSCNKNEPITILQIIKITYELLKIKTIKRIFNEHIINFTNIYEYEKIYSDIDYG